MWRGANPPVLTETAERDGAFYSPQRIRKTDTRLCFSEQSQISPASKEECFPCSGHPCSDQRGGGTQVAVTRGHSCGWAPVLRAGGQGQLTLHGELPPEDLDDLAAAEVVGEHGGVDGGGHEDDAQLRTRLNHVA